MPIPSKDNLYRKNALNTWEFKDYTFFVIPVTMHNFGVAHEILEIVVFPHKGTQSHHMGYVETETGAAYKILNYLEEEGI